MAEETNSALVRRLFDEVFNAHQLDNLDQFYAPGYHENAYWHNPAPYEVDGDLPPDRMSLEDMRQNLTTKWNLFREGQETIDELFESEDKVVVLSTFNGAYRNGKPVSYKSIQILRIEYGKVVEMTFQFDRLGYWQQLGVVPDTQELTAQLSKG